MRIVNRPLTPEVKARMPRSKQHSPFSSSYSATEALLHRELRHLAAPRVTEAVLMLDVAESMIRNDGGVKANARPYSDDVAISIETKRGPLVFPCGAFWKWQDNVRAIALGMEALRRVDRYGISPAGEQYTGWKALGSGIAVGPAPTMTEDEAARILAEAGGVPYDTDVDRVRLHAESLYRIGAKRLHPDAGGDPDEFRRLRGARDLLVPKTVVV